MKHPVILFLFFVLIDFAFSCKEESTPESISLIKRKSKFISFESTTPVGVWDYQYDKKQRLSSITLGDYFREDFVYNKGNQLITKKTFHFVNDSIGWKLTDSTVISYNNGLKEEERIFYAPFSVSTHYIKFIYDESKLIRKMEFLREDFSQLTIFEYDSIHCIKEIACHDSLGNNPFIYTYHTYDNNLLSGSESFYMNVQPLQKINYYYNNKDLLITEESIQLYSESPYDLNYVYRYEYY
jgi:hypothetical protein